MDRDSIIKITKGVMTIEDMIEQLRKRIELIY